MRGDRTFRRVVLVLLISLPWAPAPSQAAEGGVDLAPNGVGIEIFNVYDLDPSDGVDPDREYFIERDPETGELRCTLNEPALPNVFSRDWWLGNGMVYVGTETVSGFEADCWEGVIAGIGLPVKLCSRADKYPELALLLKTLGPFEFYDHFGESLEGENQPPPAYFKLPQICKGL